MLDASYSIGIKGSMVSMGKATSNSKSLPTSRLKIYTEKLLPVKASLFLVMVF